MNTFDAFSSEVMSTEEKYDIDFADSFTARIMKPFDQRLNCENIAWIIVMQNDAKCWDGWGRSYLKELQCE